MSDHKYSWKNWNGNQSLYPKHFDRVYVFVKGVWRHGVVEYHNGAFLQVHDAQSRIAFREFDEWMPADEFCDLVDGRGKLPQWVSVADRLPPVGLETLFSHTTINDPLIDFSGRWDGEINTRIKDHINVYVCNCSYTYAANYWLDGLPKFNESELSAVGGEAVDG